ncbi:uncharacterized protein Tco025E_03524 [Trypanosoma conorhini]|uniref:Uncharacterized protein n=1 Tax=Trypanosoma conorhini TaxID=83891 RepID=A0A3R7LDC5_9TRYP|nr:uncharacterized protein Tco025E_03524 [Trypanosoma conorhini]RNF21343.1 hypothetical protein Tco025E_03524 [Trypanosoma conorhini]
MPSGEPQFATVSLLLADAVEGTFRVPITDDTTVRRLAKDAMRRLLARYSAGRQVIQREKISVTEVFVKSGSNRAEIFAQDLVNQVVLIKEEVLYMRLHMRERVETGTGTGDDSRATADTTDSITARRTHTGSRMDANVPYSADARSTSEEPPQEEQKPGDIGKLNKHTSSTPSAAAVPAAVKTHEEENVKGSTQEAGEGTRVKEEGTTSAAGERKGKGTRRGLGWGPEAHKHFADNYVASPNKLMQKRWKKGRVTTRKEPPSATEKEERTEAPEKGPSPEITAVTQACRGLGWGPEAGKYFADNYVASPERITRIKSRERRLEKKKDRRRRRKRRGKYESGRSRKRKRKRQGGSSTQQTLSQTFQ